MRSTSALMPLFLIPVCLLGQEARIVRPVDLAALPPGKLSVLAKAPGGGIEVDGKRVEAVERFPGIWEAKLTLPAGEHVLRAVSEEGSHEIKIWAGSDPPPAYQAFRNHPPAAVDCDHCHGVSRRGRFRFIGGCFSCHPQEGFAAVHQHPPHIFEQCGSCHNAHGSTSAKHFVRTKQEVCGLCHTVPIAAAP